MAKVEKRHGEEGVPMQGVQGQKVSKHLQKVSEHTNQAVVSNKTIFVPPKHARSLINRARPKTGQEN